MLNMRLVADDRSTRARLRDAAVAVFARDGFGATVRAIADAAGVSPGLVIHHFGSKDKLRAECDEYVLTRTREENRRQLENNPGTAPFAAIVAQLDVVEDAGPRMIYLVRSLQDGGGMARELLEPLATDAEVTLRAGVADGTIKPSVDEAARARHLMAQSMGALLVDVVLHPPDDWSDSGAILRAYVERALIPATELAVHGVMADETLLDAVLTYRNEHTTQES